MNLRPEFIPAIVIAVPFLYSAWLWLQCKQRRVSIPFGYYRIFVVVFAMQGLMYVMFQFLPIDIVVRGFWVRVSLLNMALCFSIPLTILYGSHRRN
jgi:heme/copper-type cytochrome/quinol oxidase subunit 1